MKQNELYRLLSLLFQYPDEWVDYDISSAIEEIDDQEVRFQLRQFLHRIEAQGRERILEDYIQAFDFNEKTNLYLTYSKLKEKRERGQVFVELKLLYAEAGFYMGEEDLPDYLPLILEFLSIAPEPSIQSVLRQLQPAIEDLARELEQANSPYAHLLAAFFLALKQRSNFLNRNYPEKITLLDPVV